ncbi:MAG: CHASE2 domain-containing protein, partial [Nitrospira sp.]
MESSQYKFQRWVPAGCIGLVATVLVAILWMSGAAGLETWELRTYDLRMQWRGAGPGTNQLVVIGRDEKSDARFGIGIWDRAVFAKMIAALHRAGARVIALDFHFGGASPPERGGKVSDQALADAVASAGTVVLPVRVSLDHDPEDTSTIVPQLKQRLSAGGPVVDPGFLPQAGAIGALFPN